MPATSTRATAPVRSAAWLLDTVLFVVTLGAGWAAWAWRTSAHAATPGMALLGLTVVDTASGRPASRRRILGRGVHQALALATGVATTGLGWPYAVAGALGPGRRTLYDEWTATCVVGRSA